jgi:phosphoribosylformylglycinamidine synthase
MKAVVVVRLKTDIPDAAGSAVSQRLVDLGFSEVKDARIGKVIEVEMEAADRDNATERVKQMCERLLVNQVIEDFVLVSLQ